MNDAVSQKPSVAKTVARVFSAAFVETRHDVGDLTNLPDRWLIARVRRDPVNVHAFDALIDRHWKPLFAHCQMLTVNSEEASDLARAAWRRVLRSRRTLDPTGDLLAHLVATATDLWRKETQSLQPAEQVALPRHSSPDAPQFVDGGAEFTFTGTAVAELESLSEDEQVQLEQEIDTALGRLTPEQRDALFSRYLTA